ncbi:unannotated protein [freshwater metagenome]|uniref:Unannotated protein n=1 Tax=freshwater metagenome TaxID=449393 RepID=A0A6J7TDJ2_9ZZZZ
MSRMGASGASKLLNLAAMIASTALSSLEIARRIRRFAGVGTIIGGASEFRAFATTP